MGIANLKFFVGALFPLMLRASHHGGIIELDIMSGSWLVECRRLRECGVINSRVEVIEDCVGCREKMLTGFRRRRSPVQAGEP